MSAIEEIKGKLDIVDLVSQYGVSLKKAGRTFKACCPFHPEKTPSFIVNPDRQTWHCFGACATGGDIFAFVMKWEKVEFGQALIVLADKTAVVLPARTPEAQQDPNLRLYQMNEAASHYFHHLLRQSEAGEEARRYLEKRSISPKTVDDWQLGFSSPGWDDLSLYMGGKGYNNEDMVGAGLLVEKEGRGCYDRFRRRLMFPIFDKQGRVTGFGARALDDSMPKYLNSPQTDIFDKSRAVYGIHRAHGAIRKQDQAVIVEGYMDALMAHQKGYENTVASLGTALTQGQVEQLKSLTGNLVLALDTDAAGEEATLRGLAVAQETMERRVVYAPMRAGRTAIVRREEEYAEIRIATPPVGKDPDEVLRLDPTLWEKALSEARPVMDYLFDVVASRSDRRDPRGKRAIVESMLPFIGEIKNPITRNSYIERLARVSGVTEVDLGNQLSALLRPAVRDARPVAISAQAQRVSPDCIEDYCLSLLLRNPTLRTQGAELAPDFFSDSENRQIFQAWVEEGNPDELWSRLNDHLRPRLDALLMPEGPEPGRDQMVGVFRDCRARLEERRLKERIRLLGALAQDAETGGDEGPDPERASELRQEELTLNDLLMASYRTRMSSKPGRRGAVHRTSKI
ncbi:MAG: DNA primase [Dehalococcoidia bacterium]|nr:DNA primase [Dehalococcoidia bacterium]